MSVFLSYLVNLNYNRLFDNGKEFFKSHIYNQVHDAMDEDILSSLERKFQIQVN